MMLVPVRCLVCGEDLHDREEESDGGVVCAGCSPGFDVSLLVDRPEQAARVEEDPSWSPWLVATLVLCVPFLLLAAASAVGIVFVWLTVYGLSCALGKLWRVT